MKTRMLYSHLILSMIVICGLMTSCFSYYPRLTNVPLIKEKGDTRIEVGLGLPPSIQASFSQGATEKIAYQISGSIDPNGPFNYGNGSNTTGLYGQGAIGLYRNIQDRDVLELYGGFGCGRSDAYNDANPGHLYGNFQSYFLQFNYGYVGKNKVNLETGFGMKAGLLHSNMTDANYFMSSREDYLSNGPYPIYHLNGLLFEPTVFLRLGEKNVKFWIAFGASKYFQLNHTDKLLPASAPGFAIGVSSSFGGRNK